MSQTDIADFPSIDDALRAVLSAVTAGDFAQAARIADVALSRGLTHPAMFNARAMWLERQGKNEEALDSYQRARALTPKDTTLLNAIGLCMTRLYRLDEAIEVFDEAIRIAPAYAPTYQRKGVALGMCGRPRDAEHCYRRAIQLQPDYSEALASLAAIVARRGDSKTAGNLAAKALKTDLHNATAHAALAMCELETGDYVAAEKRLVPLLDSPELAGHGRSVAVGLLADSLDGQGRVSEAFAAYEAANAELRALHAPRFAARKTAAEVVDALSDFLEATPATDWKSRTVPDTETKNRPNRHVFLVGFHRSGTTLLEQALESHPDIVTLEERDILAPLAERFLTSAAGLERLESLEEPALALARADYWSAVRRFGPRVQNKTFVDKHPLNTIKLPLIARLFPDAEIVFALRDPRDVVLSCFRRHFEINAVMFEYLTLEGAARFYCSVMRMADICRRTLPLNFLDVRYEDVVSDFDSQLKAVCAFIGVPWSDETRRFAETAHGLDARSPSGHQVRRGLYTEGAGQWRRYEAELAGVRGILRPWIERYGYPSQ
jgi:Tfp pilus assembly protein PilF